MVCVEVKYYYWLLKAIRILGHFEDVFKVNRDLPKKYYPTEFSISGLRLKCQDLCNNGEEHQNNVNNTNIGV